MSAGTVFVLTALMAAASGLGAVPFFFVGIAVLRDGRRSRTPLLAASCWRRASTSCMRASHNGAGLVIVGVMLGAHAWMELSTPGVPAHNTASWPEHSSGSGCHSMQPVNFVVVCKCRLAVHLGEPAVAGAV